MKKEKNPTLNWSGKRLNDAAFSAAANGTRKREVMMVQMPRTASGNPRFSSRSDGAEAGIVSGGMKREMR